MLTPSLSLTEKRVVKALLNEGARNQDVHALINVGRTPTVNFGRISGVKKSKIDAATLSEVNLFKFERSLTDLKTGLSPFRDERIVRARKAMLLAVNVFNMPLVRFKVEVFSMLANVAWTYLLHEFYARRGVTILNAEGHSLPLSKMIKRADFPLSKGVSDNLGALKIIRDEVEHKVLSAFGEKYYSIFQATCLNFENALCALFGDQCSLGSELQYALQFSKVSLDQVVKSQGFEAEGVIKTIDAKLAENFTEQEMSDPHFMLKVSYTLEKASKGESHFIFQNKLSDGQEAQNVLVQKVPADENWPHKPATVVALVKQKTAKEFNSHIHIQAWRKLDVRPKGGAAKPEGTNKKFCIYHAAHGDYTYSEDWVEHLCAYIADEAQFAELKSYKI